MMHTDLTNIAPIIARCNDDHKKCVDISLNLHVKITVLYAQPLRKDVPFFPKKRSGC